MGCASSAPAVAGGHSSAFDKQLIEVVRRHAASHPRVKSLDQVLLRLPAVRDMVDSCRAVFAKAYANGGTGHEIPASAFAALAESLKLTLPPETLKDVLAVADVDGNHMISFKEFTVLLVLCWLLRPAETAEGSVSGLDRALNTLCDAFLFFDTHGNGWITKKDVQDALGGSGGGGPGAASGSMRHLGSSASQRGEPNAHAPQHAPKQGSGEASGSRFSEMDFDHNGRVSFPEFVAALESWAGVEEED